MVHNVHLWEMAELSGLRSLRLTQFVLFTETTPSDYIA